jgi:hypothetical protein
MARVFDYLDTAEIRELRRLAYRPPTADELARARAAYERIKKMHGEMFLGDDEWD